MLAAAAIVLGWGFMAAVLFIVLSIFILRSLPKQKVFFTNWILFSIVLLLIGFTFYRYQQRQKAKEADALSSTYSSPSLHLVQLHYQQPGASGKMGLGFFQPNFYEYPSIAFYGGVNLEKSLMDHTPMDSVAFAQTELGFETRYAPPWLFPEHMKLDYGILMFKVLGLGDDFLKVETNQQTKQYHYMDKLQGRFIPWHEFLLSVNSVELLDRDSQKVHIKPLTHASVVTSDFEWLVPLLIEEEWMYVKLVDGSHRAQGKGWVQWKSGDQLLISYSLLN